MSDVKLKPSSTKLYTTIRKLSLPNEHSNWDTWSFVMLMMLRGKNLEYVVEGGHKEGYNSTINLLPDAAVRADNHMVSSIITSQIHKDNFVAIVSCQDSARRMWQALSSSHQKNSASGQYMHLQAMLTAHAEGDDDLLKLIGSMDVLCQRLMNVCPEGTVSAKNLYVSSLISAVPESWTSVTAPLELQPSVTPTELKKVLCEHSVKLKN